MKMVNTMQFKAYIYVITVLLSTYTLTGINFDKIIKKNKKTETILLVMILSFIMGYILTNFIVDFVSSL